MSQKTHAAEHAKHREQVDAAITAETPRERFIQAMEAMHAKYLSLPNEQEKDLAIELSFADLPALTHHIFGS